MFFRLLALVVLMSTSMVWAAPPPEGFNDDDIIKQAVMITAQDTEPSKNAHFCKIKSDRRDKFVAVEVWLDHSKDTDKDIEAFRIYKDDKIVTKFLTKPDWHPYHFIAYLNPDKFPTGSTLVLLTNCNVDGPYKQEFVVK